MKQVDVVTTVVERGGREIPHVEVEECACATVFEAKQTCVYACACLCIFACVCVYDGDRARKQYSEVTDVRRESAHSAFPRA